MDLLLISPHIHRIFVLVVSVGNQEENMGKRLLITPRSKVRAALRQLWLRSRERQAALKRDKYTCQKCNHKQSKAKGKEFKVEVHHIEGMNWDRLIDFVYESGLLCSSDKLKTLCPKCHDELIGDNHESH